MEMPNADEFNNPFNSSVSSDLIAYPMDFFMIRERLKKHYYRRPEAIKWDLRLIQSNTNKIHISEHDIIERVDLLVKVMLEFIDDKNCTEPTIIYERMFQASVESKKRKNLSNNFSDLNLVKRPR